jgi:sugar transferase EpsL
MDFEISPMSVQDQHPLQRALKRILDFAAALTLLLGLSPLFFVLALLIRLTMGAPVFFRHLRPGYREQIFTLYKFRTMTNETDQHGQLLPDDQRLTRLGKVILSLILDELPQLYNVLKGDLSLVGPRPLLVEYLERYSPEQRRRHQVKPGITGWAQVNGRNAVSWEEKFKLDVWYVDHWSLGLDFKILFMTVWKVFTREGISQKGQATMQEFLGYQDPEGRDHGTMSLPSPLNAGESSTPASCRR